MRSKSSKQWLDRHFDDEYVRRAQKEGWRSRAAFKLIELNQKYHFLKPGLSVVDLGAAPGGWSQVLSRLLGDEGKAFALDILPMDALPGVSFIQGDFCEDAVLEQLLEQLGEEKVDLILSDMAPNMSGQKHTDQARAMYLADLALDFVQQRLKPKGMFIIKLFHGAEFDQYVKTLRDTFQKVIIKKPNASRAESKEVYALCTAFK
jgi:23S rRNA (uridine2552-2'-O)-methyltransferase